MPNHPPLDGSLLVLPGFVDFYALRDPHRPWAVVAPDLVQDPLSVSFLDLAYATHRIAHIMSPPLDPVAPGTVVAILANCDTIVYLALIIGMSRAGLVPFPISPRNSPEAVVHLLKSTACHRIIVHGMLPSMIQAIRSDLSLSEFDLHERDIPTLAELFPCFETTQPPNELDPYPLRKDVGLDDLTLYLHSSGSTGLPKPIPWRQRQLLQICRSSIVRDARDHGVKWGAMALPTFHAMGIIIQLCGPIASGHYVGLYWPKYPAPPMVPTPQNAIRACQATGCTGMPSVPAFVEAWSQSEDTIKFLSSLSILVFAGGPLSDKIGNKLVQAGVPLYAWYGGTEFGAPTRTFDAVPADDGSRKTRDEWQWMEFPSDTVSCRWVPEGDGSYELQFLTCDIHIPSVQNMEDGYATSDLWEPHPKKPWLWRITGRKDDVIVLGSGEKVVPIPQEGIVTSHPMVSGAIMFGRGMNECGILVELVPHEAEDYADPSSIINLRQAIWSIVEEANLASPTYARIFKEMIIVADPARPLPRAPKGTIIRKQTLALYSEDIETLYKTVADSSGVQGMVPPVSWSREHVEPWLAHHAVSINSGKCILPEVDIFEQGFDSLHATFLRNRIIGALRLSDDICARRAAQNISPNFIFEHSTLRGLASTLANLVSPDTRPADVNLSDSIRDMINKYTTDLPRPSPVAQGAYSDLVVLLTGTTGNLGSHILAALLREPRVRKVYAFNRPHSDIAQRQLAAFGERGISTELSSDPKLMYISGYFYKPNFDLETAQYEEILNCVTHVVHNAWRVDFNHSLASFESHVAGTRRLVDMCSASARSARLIFTSSISATHKWDVSLGPVPEQAAEDCELATSSGYAASKFVVENVLAAAYKNGLPCTSLRVGQVCGPRAQGAWAINEWVPNLVKSSLSLNAFPELGGTVSWIPADGLSSAVIDLVICETPLPPLLNLVHPRGILWSKMLDTFKSCLGRPGMAVVSLSQWVAMVEDASEKAIAEDIHRIPAIKLLDFFRGMAHASALASLAGVQHMEAGGLPLYETTKLESICQSIRDLECLDESHTSAWVHYWRSKGFIDSN